jgi:hypothetical protein
VRSLLSFSFALLLSACSSSKDVGESPDDDAGHDVGTDLGVDAPKGDADAGADTSADTGGPSDTRASETTDATDATDTADTAPSVDTTTVPLAVVTRNSGGGLGFALDVGIGASAPKSLLVDTGSAGVHVLADAIDPASITRTGKSIKEVYVDGTELLGEEAMAVVQIGAASTGAKIAIHVIDTIDCVAGKPSCPGSVGADFFRAHGFVGIVGIGMSNAIATPSVFDPIAQMPGNLASGYIVHASPFGSTAGTLTIGLTSVNTAGFSTKALSPQTSPLPNGAPAWEDAKIDVCFEMDGTSMGCGPSIFDTGATATFWNQSVSSSKLTLGALSPGTSWRATIAGVLDWSFTVGSPAKPGLDMVIPSPGGFNTNLGIGVFFAFDVMFDLKKGNLGVR